MGTLYFCFPWQNNLLNFFLQSLAQNPLSANNVCGLVLIDVFQTQFEHV